MADFREIVETETAESLAEAEEIAQKMWGKVGGAPLKEESDPANQIQNKLETEHYWEAVKTLGKKVEGGVVALRSRHGGYLLIRWAWF